LTLISKILQIPPSSDESCLVEAGCYYGATSCTMSIAAKILKKKLIIYDSFFGLPDDDDKELKIYDHLKIKGFYKKGMYAASKKDVEQNVLKYGEYKNCLFREGLFSDTMPKHTEKICFLFLDVDLKSSTKTSIKYLYPYMKDNHYIFTDDSCDLSIIKIWFDENFWNKELNCSAPGYVGSGCGLPINGEFSSLGYSIKNLDANLLQNVKWLNKEPSIF
jgi:O-methyltransferase